MALEPSGNSASNIEAGEPSEDRESSLRSPAHTGFAEQAALFRPILHLPVELHALRGRIDPVFLRWAANRAEVLGISADVVVRRCGVMHPDAMLDAYAKFLNTTVDPLEDVAPSPLPLEELLSSGVLQAGSRPGQAGPTIALLNGNTKRICERVASVPALAENFRITSPERLRAFAERSNARQLAEGAAFGLMKEAPALSAGVGNFVHYRSTLLAFVAAFVLLLYFSAPVALFLVELILATTFLSWSALRVFACFTKHREKRPAYIEDRDLPIYTILIPLHREAGVVAELVEAISALNYPREKLDVKLVLEADDPETNAAINAIVLDPCFEIVFAPPDGPRTKPKALRAALPFARGEYLVVYDAEDRPHPNQLRDAYARFLASGDRLACVQAKLAIDNAYSSFLTAQFRAEYYGLFDVLLPALVRLRLPIPLGGTSNHFATKALREVGAWDPHNVTEDADLGIRLARFGYQTDFVDSTTYEEAPAHLAGWLPQRTRWMKGWMQTYLVHMRNPFRLLSDLGARGFIAFQLLIGGSVLAAVVHPIFFVWLIADAAFGTLLVPGETVAQWTQKSLVVLTLLSGYAASGLLAVTGMRRRGVSPSIRIVVMIPIYWLLLSAAAWRAVWKFFTAPYQWEKTAHGVVKRNRQIFP